MSSGCDRVDHKMMCPQGEEAHTFACFNFQPGRYILGHGK
jgi:hypothetical protein